MACLRPPRNVKLGIFPSVVVQWRQRNVKKIAWCACAVVVLPMQLIAFLTFSLSSPSWPPKVPNMTLLEAWLQTSISKTYFGLLISTAIACVEALFLTGYQPSYNPLRRCISPGNKVSHFPSWNSPLIFKTLDILAVGGNFAEMQFSPEQSDKTVLPRPFVFLIVQFCT